MEPYLVFLRLLHVGLGVYWAGTLLFVATFLLPSVRDAGPDGGRVMIALQRRRFLDVLPAVAALTIVSGLLLYWQVSGGLNGAWLRSPTGLSFTVGGIAALLAFGIGVGVMRPASLRAGSLAQSLEGADREARAAEIQQLRQRAGTSARWVASLLGLATALMAVARYV